MPTAMKRQRIRLKFLICLSRVSLYPIQGFGYDEPGPPAHWMKKNFIDRAEEIDAQVWQFSLDDNSFIDDKYKAWLKATYTGLWRKRMIEGLWAIASGAVFANFDPDLHCVGGLPDMPMDQLRIGIDYGASNPTVFIKLARYQGVWIAIDEYYHRPKEQHQKTNSEYAADLKAFQGGLHPTSIEVDPSAAAFIFEARSAGIRACTVQRMMFSEYPEDKQRPECRYSEDKRPLPKSH